MQSLTKNEARIMDFLLRNFSERNSINEIARRLSLSPKGAHKILKKLEQLKVILPEQIGNAIYYKPNLEEELGRKLAEFVLVQNDLNPYASIQAEDLKPLKGMTQACMIFGSVINKGKESRDTDVMLVMEKKDYRKVIESLDKIRSLKPKKIHEVVQTKEDLIKNVQKRDEVILDIIRYGKVLWGAEIIVDGIRHGSREKQA